jgi:hypothetical protein
LIARASVRCAARVRAAIVLALWLPMSAAAQQSGAALPPRVRLIHGACPLYDAAELERLLRVELASLGITQLVVTRQEPPDAQSLDADLAVLRLACVAAEQRVALQLADLASGKALEREVPLVAVEPKARARLLSMSAAGLIESSWTELALSPAPDPARGVVLPTPVREALRQRLRAGLIAEPQTPPSRPPAPSEPGPAESPAAAARWQLSAAAVVRAFPARATGLAGLPLGYGVLLANRLRLALDADGALGSHELNDAQGQIGSMHLYWITFGVGLEWLTPSVPELAIGPFARAGYGVARGESDRAGLRASTSSGPVSALGVRAALQAPLGGAVSAKVALEGGYMPSGVVFIAAQNRAAGMAEVVAALSVGVSIAP